MEYLLFVTFGMDHEKCTASKVQDWAVRNELSPSRQRSGVAGLASPVNVSPVNVSSVNVSPA